MNWCEKRRVSPVMHWVSCGKNPLECSALDCTSTASSKSKEEVPEAQQHLGKSRSRPKGHHEPPAESSTDRPRGLQLYFSKRRYP